MKIRIFKLFMLPIAAFTLASAAAVSTNQPKEGKAATSMIAYIHNPNEFNCLPVEVECEEGIGTPCTAPGGWTAYGLNGTVCDQTLKRVQ
ncbi:DUF6520 family protein [Flavobacterium sp.]|uniref:DUF6520 family protein n=1 Tax=Flavobacterium sp. TaxID=239 RepID=UPI003919CAF5